MSTSIASKKMTSSQLSSPGFHFVEPPDRGGTDSYQCAPTPAPTPVDSRRSKHQQYLQTHEVLWSNTSMSQVKSPEDAFMSFDVYDFGFNRIKNNDETRAKRLESQVQRQREDEDNAAEDRKLLHPRPQRYSNPLLTSSFHAKPASTYRPPIDDREDTKSGESHAPHFAASFLFPSASKSVHFLNDDIRYQASASVGPSTFGVPGFEEYTRRAQSLSPSLFIDEQSSVGSSLGYNPGSSSKLKKKKDDKKKHGSFKIWHRNASEELQVAYNAIYGLPLYGSVAFIGRKPFGDDDDDEIQIDEEVHFTHIVKRFDGPAHVDKLLMGTWDAAIDSAGKDDGDYAKIVINGKDYSENKRGFNLAILTPETGEVKVEAFDTHGLPEEAEKLAVFVAQAPPGSFVLGAVRDDGAKFLGDIGRAALRLIGVKVPKADDALALQEVVEALPPDRTRVLLTVCAKANAKNCARVLLQNGWDIHTRASHTMNTPLHDAVYQRNTDIAIVLLDCGADSSLENKWGETPENIAQKKFGFASLEHMIMSSDRHIQSVIRFIGLE